MKKHKMSERQRSDWVMIMSLSVIFLFCTSMILYVVAERRKEDAEYFKGRMAALETRMNNADKRMDSFDGRLDEINRNIKDMSTLTVQINTNVLENSKRLEDILNPPKPLVKKGKPKSAFRPERLTPKTEPVIQGPRPEPPPLRKGVYAIEGKQQ